MDTSVLRSRWLAICLCCWGLCQASSMHRIYQPFGNKMCLNQCYKVGDCWCVRVQLSHCKCTLYRDKKLCNGGNEKIQVREHFCSKDYTVVVTRKGHRRCIYSGPFEERVKQLQQQRNTEEVQTNKQQQNFQVSQNILAPFPTNSKYRQSDRNNTIQQNASDTEASENSKFQQNTVTLSLGDTSNEQKSLKEDPRIRNGNQQNSLKQAPKNCNQQNASMIEFQPCQYTYIKIEFDRLTAHKSCSVDSKGSLACGKARRGRHRGKRSGRRVKHFSGALANRSIQPSSILTVMTYHVTGKSCLLALCRDKGRLYNTIMLVNENCFGIDIHLQGMGNVCVFDFQGTLNRKVNNKRLCKILRKTIKITVIVDNVKGNIYFYEHTHLIRVKSYRGIEASALWPVVDTHGHSKVESVKTSQEHLKVLMNTVFTCQLLRNEGNSSGSAAKRNMNKPKKSMKR